ncbi:MAG: KpsF/GutQ family sugar-phosphate isomerase [Candidatus Protistobacter heckmanni]|nr:KpsF/GutQ family sugar-phosphate isomerase [Candidatus Protistobacter heckmanni]
MIANFNPDQALALGRETLLIEAEAVLVLAERVRTQPLSDAFVRSVGLLLECNGRVVVSGIGKSGHIARKLAATFASTGTPAFFVHPAEASHGDLGMVTREDVFVALSNSGETSELLTIVPLIKRTGAKLIAMTGNADSALAKLADAHLDARVEKEACPLNLAPTASTTAALALGDALAVAVLEARGFGPEDFARSHPGGALGRKLLTHVSDVMRTGDQVPRTRADASVAEALPEITAKRLGMTVVVDDADRAIGIFTDGDLRRMLEQRSDIKTTKVAEVMTANPRSIAPNQLAAEAVELMERHRIMQVAVVDAQGKLAGALNLHDLFAARVI